MLGSLEPLGDEGAFLGFLQRRAHSVSASVQKGDFLTGLALGVGDFVHVICNEIANALVEVSVLIAERVGDGLPGNIRGRGVGLAFEGVLHDVHLQGVIGHVRIKPSITCQNEIVDALEVAVSGEVVQMLPGGRSQKKDDSVRVGSPDVRQMWLLGGVRVVPPHLD